MNGAWASSSDDSGAASACLAGPVRALCSCIASGVVLPLESVAEDSFEEWWSDVSSRLW